MRKIARERADKIRNMKNQHKRTFSISLHEGQMVIVRENNPNK